MSQFTGTPWSVAVIGAAGFLGSVALRHLHEGPGRPGRLIAVDVREVPAERRLAGVAYEMCDVRDARLADLLRRHEVDTVVHLAAIVNPPKMKGGRAAEAALAYDVDVNGTRNVLDACEEAGVAHLVYCSSGAAYGFHDDNPEWLREEHPLRGNDEFPYARHKRLAEEMLAARRAEGRGPRQLIVRPGTILGAGTRNLITDLFDKPVILGFQGAATPFIFVWVEDVAAVIAKGARERREGIFNLAGDGALPIAEIARRLGKTLVKLPPAIVHAGLAALRASGLTQYGPEQMGFLRYRSALSNDRLKSELGYTPTLDSREVFELWRASRLDADRGAAIEEEARARLRVRLARESAEVALERRASGPGGAPEPEGAEAAATAA
jgi:UDP-glucose 4-epimerase